MDRRVALLAVALTWLAAGLADPAEAGRKDGELVRISGQILDPDGRPLEGLTVILEATHTSYSFLKREKITEPALRQTTTSDAAGRFRLDWQWDRHYNEMSLATGLEVTRSGKPDFEILSRTDITERAQLDVPPNVTLTVERPGYARWLRQYLSGRASADEQRIYREANGPDRISSDETSTSWWYFKLGKVYRFEDGKLDQVIHFDPIGSSP